MKNIFKLTFVLFSLFISIISVSADFITDPSLAEMSGEVGIMLIIAGVIIVPVIVISYFAIRRIKKNGDANNK